MENKIKHFKNNNNRNQLIALVFIVCSIIIILYFGVFYDEGIESSVVNQGVISVDQIKILSVLDLDLDFLKTSSFKSLTMNGGIPINIQLEGRSNPFISY